MHAEIHCVVNPLREKRALNTADSPTYQKRPIDQQSHIGIWRQTQNKFASETNSA